MFSLGRHALAHLHTAVYRGMLIFCSLLLTVFGGRGWGGGVSFPKVKPFLPILSATVLYQNKSDFISCLVIQYCIYSVARVKLEVSLN